MTHTTAKQLLDRYFLGETTLEEEQQLRAYFRAGDIHPDLAIYPPLFAYWDDASEIKAPVRIHSVRRRRPLRWLGAAAAAVLLIGLNTWLLPPIGTSESDTSVAQTIDWDQYEVTDPEEAYKILRGALKTTSSSMNHGTNIAIREMIEVRNVLR